MRFHLQRTLFTLVALLLASPAWAQQSALTVPRNLGQLVERSAVIVRGNVTSVRMEKHPELGNLDTVVVTLRVRESLKGDVGDSYSFRQYLWDIRDRSMAGGYRKGQNLLLMLIAPSRYGLSSPAGFDQGRFRIQRDQAGREVAVNGRANAGLLDGIGARFAQQGKVLALGPTRLIESHRQGPIAVDELSNLVRELVRE